MKLSLIYNEIDNSARNIIKIDKIINKRIT